MRILIFTAFMASTSAFGQGRTLVYLYSSALSDNDHTLEQTLEADKVFERFKNTVVGEVDPDLDIIPVDVQELNTDVRDVTGIAGEAQIKELSGKIAELINAKSNGAIVEGLVFFGHGNQEVYEFNRNSFGSKTFSKVVATLLENLKVSSNLFVHFSGCLMGADVAEGAKNFQFNFLKYLSQELTNRKKIGFNQIDITANIYAMNSNSVGRTGIIERLILRAKLPQIINRYLMKLSFHPAAMPFIQLLPAFTGIMYAKFATEGMPGTSIASAIGIGVTVLSKLGAFVNGTLVKRMTYKDGAIIESKGFFDEQAKAALTHTCEGMAVSQHLIKPM